MKKRGRRKLLIASLLGALPLLPPWRGLATAAQARIEGLRRVGYSIADRLDQFGDAARARWLPHFEQAKLRYPPQACALIAFKDERRVQVHARTGGAPWRFVSAYPVRAASGALGPKLRQGDQQVPEGIYRIVLLNPNSSYHVSLRLDYPNAFDRRMAAHDGRRGLGGDIMIHGRAVSIGCLAMGDEAAEDLFTLVADTGLANAHCIISPTDFRAREHGAPATDLPQWAPELYRTIRDALANYPGAT
jgi:hypothetical protein